jgi:GDP-4-dehydro-6-deoxy-D-mannose reductase
VRVLITGALGFTGRHLVERLRSDGEHQIVGTDCAAHAPRAGNLDEYHPADAGDYRQLLSVVQKARPDWIFHLAGMFRGSSADIYRINLLASVNLLEAIKNECPHASVLLVGSAAEYGIWPAAEMPLDENHECRPVGAYAVSKYSMTLAALDYARTAGIKAVVARPFNLIGAGLPGSLVVGAILQRMKLALNDGDPSITIGNTSSFRDFIAVEDAVDAYVKLIQSEQRGEVFNVCSGEPTSIDSVIQTLLSYLPKPIKVVSDAALLRRDDAQLVVGNPAKLKRVCGFSPRISLPDALRSTFEEAMQETAGLATAPRA